MIGTLFAETRKLSPVDSRGISEQVIAMSKALRQERQQDAQRRAEADD